MEHWWFWCKHYKLILISICYLLKQRCFIDDSLKKHRWGIDEKLMKSMETFSCIDYNAKRSTFIKMMLLECFVDDFSKWIYVKLMILQWNSDASLIPGSQTYLKFRGTKQYRWQKLLAGSDIWAVRHSLSKFTSENHICSRKFSTIFISISYRKNYILLSWAID